MHSHINIEHLNDTSSEFQSGNKIIQFPYNIKKDGWQSVLSSKILSYHMLQQ